MICAIYTWEIAGHFSFLHHLDKFKVKPWRQKKAQCELLRTSVHSRPHHLDHHPLVSWHVLLMLLLS